MRISGGQALIALAAGAGIMAGSMYLVGCTKQGGSQDGPMGDLTKQLMEQIRPGSPKGGLDVAKDGVRQVKGDDGRVTGSYDGRRLIAAADSHAYGTPVITDAAKDVKGDGTATFNEVRQVLAHFDADASGAFDQDEKNAFEAAAAVRWVPAATRTA